MRTSLLILISFVVAPSAACWSEETDWWNSGWRYRIHLSRRTPHRDDTPRPVEAAIDFPLLLKQAGIEGMFDPDSLRVVPRAGRTDLATAWRSEFDARSGREVAYLAWIAQPRLTRLGAYDVYFETTDRDLDSAAHQDDRLPPENLLTNPSFEDISKDRPVGWQVSPVQLARLGQFAQTSGQRSLAVVVDHETPPGVERSISISQRIDVQEFAGQELVFQCDLLAEQAMYGAPVRVELEQFREDGSRIVEYAIQPRWLTLELAQGQLVQLCQRGRFSPDVKTVDVRIHMRLSVRDADSGNRLVGPESHFLIWLDRLVVRPGERWSWPSEPGAEFVEGALADAPLNRAFEFQGSRRVAFNGASEGSLTYGKYNPDPRSVHWGPVTGTLEFWCQPTWNSADRRDRVFFEGVAYGHRLQSLFRTRNADGRRQLEFSIADTDGSRHTVSGPAPLQTGDWHHLAATWDLPSAHLQLFVDGALIGKQGPHDEPWPSSLTPRGKATHRGIGIMQDDRRSLPMQAFIGGDRSCSETSSAEAVLDEFRISDVVRYRAPFLPLRKEFPIDEPTRALFHFERSADGIHAGDDHFVDGYPASELPRTSEHVALDVLVGGRMSRQMVKVRPSASEDLFEANRAEQRLCVTRPSRDLPDPKFIEYRAREEMRIVRSMEDEFTLKVDGDLEPLMRSITFEHADPSSTSSTLLPRWRANDNVVPFSFRDLANTLGPHARTDAEKAFAAFEYALATTNYYDANICETLLGKHRPRVSYTLTKALNCYAFDQCGPLNHTLRKLFLAAGISSNDASGTHHQFEQAYYDGDLRLFDLSPRMYWLGRDNRTVASRREFEQDLYLKVRQDSGVASGLPGRVSRARYGNAERPHGMDFPLRRGERVSVNWHNEGRWIELTGDRRPSSLSKIPPYFGNGAIVYSPAGGSEASEFDNVVVEPGPKGATTVRAADPSRAASLTYRVASPYVLSDVRFLGRYTAKQADAIRARLSFDEGNTWQETWSSQRRDGRLDLNPIDNVTARFAYWVKIELAPNTAAELSDFQVRSTFVASPLALPGRLSLGDNRIRFVGGPVSAPVKTVCRWVERRRSELGVSTNAIQFYMNGDQSLRTVFVLAPGDELPVRVGLHGRMGRPNVTVEGLPRGWTADPETGPIVSKNDNSMGRVDFVLRTPIVEQGQVEAFSAVIRNGDDRRRVDAQVLVAEAPLVREAERADASEGRASPFELPELSGAKGVAFHGDGSLVFHTVVKREGDYALWVRARWEPDHSTAMSLAIDGGKPRSFRATAMIGFTNWTEPRYAHTKMFAHFGEQYSHWSWYRLADVHLEAGDRRLTLAASSGASFDALLVLPQNDAVDRAAMNLFMNWNYAPWDNSL